MPIPLNKLAGAELLPQEIKAKDPRVCLHESDKKYNEAVDELDFCAIDFDKVELYKIIIIAAQHDSFYETVQELISKAEKFLKIVRVSDEVKS